MQLRKNCDVICNQNVGETQKSTTLAFSLLVPKKRLDKEARLEKFRELNFISPDDLFTIFSRGHDLHDKFVCVRKSHQASDRNSFVYRAAHLAVASNHD